MSAWADGSASPNANRAESSALLGVLRLESGTGHAENDWHASRDSGPVTQPLPRITADMTAPPPAAPKARSYVESLFL